MFNKKKRFLRVLCLAPTAEGFQQWLYLAHQEATDSELVKKDRYIIGDNICQFTYMQAPEQLRGSDVKGNVVLVLPNFGQRQDAWQFRQIMEGFGRARVIVVSEFRFPEFSGVPSVIDPDDSRLNMDKG